MISCLVLVQYQRITSMSSVQSLSHVRLWDPMNCSTPGLPVHHQLPEILKLMSIESMMPSNHLILCCPVLLLPSVFPSIRVFSSESALCIRCPKYWSFSFSISPSVEYSGLISFKVDWFDLFAVQGTLKNFLQHHSLKASVLQCLSIFRIHLSHPYKPGEKASEWNLSGWHLDLGCSWL